MDGKIAFWQQNDKGYYYSMMCHTETVQIFLITVGGNEQALNLSLLRNDATVDE